MPLLACRELLEQNRNSGPERRGVEHLNVFVAPEVSRIERQDSGNSAGLHDGCQARVMDIRASYFVRDDQAPLRAVMPEQ
jgi:hypothetical protein